MEWLLSAATSTVFLGIIGYIFRESILKTLLKGVEHRYDRKLSALQSDLRTNELELATFREHALTLISAEHQILVEKRILAAQELWDSACSIQKLKFNAEFLKTLKTDEIDNNIGNESTRQFIDAISTGLDTENFKEKISSQRSRPFVSPYAWALYSAYSAVLHHGLVLMLAWKNGLKAKKLLKNEELIAVVVAALPHQKKFIEELGVDGTFYLIDELENALVFELRQFVDGKKNDQDKLDRARRIIESVKNIDAKPNMFSDSSVSEEEANAFMKKELN